MENEKSFHSIVSHEDNVDQDFLDKLFPKLQSLNPRFYCQTGMYDEETAELIVSAESDIKTFVFVEDLVAAAVRFAVQVESESKASRQQHEYPCRYKIFFHGSLIVEYLQQDNSRFRHWERVRALSSPYSGLLRN
jgi:hypothetical protein